MAIDVPFDVSQTIPVGSLRAAPNDPEEMRLGVEWLREQARASAVSQEQARLLGLAGGLAGILGDHQAARQDLEAAIVIADEHGDTRQQIVLRIRLADVVALSGAPGKAAESLRELLPRCERDSSLTSLIDFVHQHLGKALLEAGEIQSGIEHLEQALALRIDKGDDDLIASTREALEVGTEMLSDRRQ